MRHVFALRYFGHVHPGPDFYHMFLSLLYTKFGFFKLIVLLSTHLKKTRIGGLIKGSLSNNHLV